MRATDAAAAARLNSARQLEELRSLTTGMAVNSASVDRQRQLLRDTDDELQKFRSEIRTETPAEIDLDDNAPVASWLTRIVRWAEIRTLALTAWDDLRRALSDAEDTKATLEKEQDKLATTLIGVGIDVDGLEIAALMQAADTILADHAAMQTKRHDAQKRVGELEAAADRRKAELDEAIFASDAWQTDWSSSLEGIWFNGDGKVGAVRELLDALAGLPEVLREKDDLFHRIHSMEVDQKSFIDAVAQVHDALAETFDGSAPLDAAKALLRRREEARQVEAKRQEREQSLVDLATERERLRF